MSNKIEEMTPSQVCMAELAKPMIEDFRETEKNCPDGHCTFVIFGYNREKMHSLAHSNGLSKVLFLVKLEKTINSMLNKNNVFSIYQIDSDGYRITIAHWDAFSDCEKDYLKNFVINN